MSTDQVKPARKRPHGKQEYRGNGQHEWERVVAGVYRLRVPSGWLYRDEVVDAVTFVPLADAIGYAV